MTVKLLALTAIIAAVGAPAFAADMPARAPAAAPPAPPMINNFYVEGYGGERLANTLLWNDGSYDLAAGAAFGATFGVNTSIPGLAFDIDAQQTNSYYSCCGTEDVLNSTTVMADVDYSVPLMDSFSVFGGAGVGGL